MDYSEIKEKEIIPILQKIVEFQTVNPPGKTIDAIKYIAELFEKDNITFKVQEYQKDHANLVAEYGKGKESIILCGHIDVVPAGDETKWKFPPFSGKDAEGKIWGRGTTDMKGSLAAYIAILKKLNEQKIALNKKVKLVITSDEEVGMEGAKAILKTGMMEDCEFIVIGEPTELYLAIAQKGVLWIRIKIKGESAHGSTPHLGSNAIEAAVDLIPQIKKTVPPNKHEILEQSTLNIGKIDGGTSFNVVPEFCEFTLDYRLIPNIDSEDILRDIKNKIEKINQTNKVKISVEVEHSIPPIEMKRKSPFFSLLKENIEKIDKGKILGVTYGTDGAILVPPHNTPFVIFGPGRLDKLHVTDENTRKAEVIEYANILYKTIVNFCGNK